METSQRIAPRIIPYKGRLYTFAEVNGRIALIIKAPEPLAHWDKVTEDGPISNGTREFHIDEVDEERGSIIISIADRRRFRYYFEVGEWEEVVLNS